MRVFAGCMCVGEGMDVLRQCSMYALNHVNVCYAGVRGGLCVGGMCMFVCACIEWYLSVLARRDGVRVCVTVFL